MTAPEHPVAALLAERRASGSLPGARADGAKVALVIEGGGTRGAISAGMAIALEEHGFGDAFDDVYGTSAGALNAAWFVGGAAREGLPGWAEPEVANGSVRRTNLLRRKPLLDSEFIMDVVYEQRTPLPFAQVVDGAVGMHPIGTDVDTGESRDLAPWIDSIPTLKLGMRASMALPLIAGRPVELGGHRWYDGGIAECVPYRAAIAQGATHVLVLRSRRRDEQQPSDGGRSAAMVARYLGRYSDGLAEAFLARPARLLAEDQELRDLESTLGPGPVVLSVRPADDMPTISRLERDLEVVRIGLLAGEMSLADTLGVAAGVR